MGVIFEFQKKELKENKLCKWNLSKKNIKYPDNSMTRSRDLYSLMHKSSLGVGDTVIRILK